MSHHLPALLIVIPLISAFVVTLAGLMDKRLCFPLTAGALGAAFLCACRLLYMVIVSGPITYNLGGWPGPVGIVYHLDHLNALVLVVVSGVALLNLLATFQTAFDQFEDRLGAFYTLYILFATGLMGIVATGDAFNLYVLLEISSLTGYALIGMGNKRAPLAGLNYVFMGTVGASFYLLGVGYLYLVTGSLNMADLARLLPALYGSKVLLAAFLLVLTGMFIKMALFPAHGWLPNAYSSTPDPASGLIAPLTTKVMVYVMVRMGLTVFTPQYAFNVTGLAPAMVWLSIIAIVMGGIFALAQRRLKRMLTYVVVGEVGYMVGGFWLGNANGVTGAVLHIVNDAAMTLCVFLAAGAILTRVKDDRFENLQGLFKKMPFTMAAFAFGAVSIIGVPPTCGFFSKWYLISGGIQAGQYGFVAALLFSSLVNVILFVRIAEIAYYEPLSHGHGDHGHSPVAINDAPPVLVAGLLAAAIFLVVLGLFTGPLVDRVIKLAIPPGL